VKFSKYHALGNAYLVVPPWPEDGAQAASQIARLCDPRLGVGSDGVLLGPLPSTRADFRLRIFNPDGSEAEKSGNGLRIFARHLWDQALVRDAAFTIETTGGIVTAQVLGEGEAVRVDMGEVRFPRTPFATEEMVLHGQRITYCRASVGNPHCVVLDPEPTEARARQVGPLLERHPLFPDRTNVQFMAVVDRRNIRIEIWERGAGYTFASGSSSCAAAAVAHKLGLCDAGIDVHMRGGILRIDLDAEFNASMAGPVVYICKGDVDVGD
jgi:diaminopimelate epimerase